jgi:hypothetical protein
MHIEGKWRTDLTFRVLKEDIIEKCGFIEPASFDGTFEGALACLCKKIISYTGVDSKVVTDTIRDFAGRKYLKAEITDKGCVWSWG